MSLTYSALDRVHAEALLEKHNPLLALRPNSSELNRPGAVWGGTRGRGDYHPCSAEFFLRYAVQYDRLRPPQGVWHSDGAVGYDKIKERVEEGYRDSGSWELDVQFISAAPLWAFVHGASRTWRQYVEAVKENPALSRSVCYARALRADSCDKILLQYFYLYIYNDAANKHEGDWEMAAIELDGTSELPTRVGYSGHRGGAQRPWEGVTRLGDRPVVFVARGSHASYVDHVPGGHHTAKADWNKGLPKFLQAPVSWIERFISQGLFFLGVRDFTYSVVYSGVDEMTAPISPNVVMFPDVLPEPESNDWDDFWWTRIDCRWGSSRTGVKDFIAPHPAWKQGKKWCDPLEWMCCLPRR